MNMHEFIYNFPKNDLFGDLKFVFSYISFQTIDLVGRLAKTRFIPEFRIRLLNFLWPSET